jgi:Ca2+-binding EF-hand superfamily protein
MFDTDGKGWFGRDELMEVMVELSGGNKPAADDVDVVFAELDCNGDGRVDFCEFLAKFMVRCPPATPL